MRTQILYFALLCVTDLTIGISIASLTNDPSSSYGSDYYGNADADAEGYPSGRAVDITRRQISPMEIWGFVTGLLHLYRALAPHLPTTPDDPDKDAYVVHLETGINHDEDLCGAEGQLPTIELFDLRGELLGVNSKPLPLFEGQTKSIMVRPVDPQHASKDPVFLTLTARTKDPICISTGMVTEAVSGRKYGFSASTLKSCGFKWANSGRGNDGWDINEDTPCFWLGGENGPAWIQVGVRSHTAKSGEQLDLKALNKSRDALHDHFCNTPMRLQQLAEKPAQSRQALVTHANVKGDRLKPYSDEEIAANEVKNG